MKQLFLLAISACLTTACVVTPYNNQPGGAPGEPIVFSGYTPYADATLQIQALDKATNTWTPVAVTTSSDTVSLNVAGLDLYYYNTSVTLNYTSHATSGCYYGYSTVTGCVAEGLPNLRVVQPDQGYTYITFDKGGISCLTDELQDGTALANAISNCASPQSPVITMQWVW